MKTNWIYGIGLFTIVSCTSGGEHKENTEAQEVQMDETQPKCLYSFDTTAKTEVLWVAYKYTEKTGVKGVFDKINIDAHGVGASPADVLQNAVLHILTGSVNSGDATRDPKIVSSFFGELTDGEHLKGKITKVDEAAQKVSVDIAMNGSIQTVEGSYAMEGETLELKLELNLSNWGADAAISSLNMVCQDLHKGSDGKSILWPEVTVFVTTTLAKTCE